MPVSIRERFHHRREHHAALGGTQPGVLGADQVGQGAAVVLADRAVQRRGEKQPWAASASIASSRPRRGDRHLGGSRRTAEVLTELLPGGGETRLRLLEASRRAHRRPSPGSTCVPPPGSWGQRGQEVPVEGRVKARAARTSPRYTTWARSSSDTPRPRYRVEIERATSMFKVTTSSSTRAFVLVGYLGRLLERADVIELRCSARRTATVREAHRAPVRRSGGWGTRVLMSWLTEGACGPTRRRLQRDASSDRHTQPALLLLYPVGGISVSSTSDRRAPRSRSRRYVWWATWVPTPPGVSTRRL